MSPKLSAVLLAVALSLSGCATQYVMSTSAGAMITTKDKPSFDAKTGMYSYEDTNGKKGSIAKSEVVQMIER